MTHPLTGVRAVVYDLDGTLYEDTRHFDIYARLVQEEFPETVRASFWNDYATATDAKHPALRVGTLYHAGQDLVLHVRDGAVARALRWDGTELTDAERKALFPGQVEVDHETIMSIGDLWWVPAAVATHYGGTAAHRRASFLRVRDLMAEADFVINRIEGLQDVVASLQGKVVQVLATNSPQPDSEAILRKLGLLELLDRKYYVANKPGGITRILQEVAQDYNLQPSQILSVGDNFINEIIPSRRFGARTVFIDPYGFANTGDADLVVSGMTELLPVLRTLA